MSNSIKALILVAVLIAMMAFIYATSINVTGGGGVSFNGSPVNLNGSHLYNGSANFTNITLRANSTKGINMTYYPNGSFIITEVS